MTIRMQRTREGPRLDHVWLALVPLLVALKVLLTPLVAHDFWWHLAYGRDILTRGTIPSADTFSFSRAGAPYFDQPWLAQVLMYLGYQTIGAAGLQLVQTLIVAGSYLLIERLCESAGADRRVAAFAALLAAVAAYDNWQVRPQTYVLPLWIATIGMLDRWRRHGTRPWALVPIVMLWSNLHGTFTLPLALGGIFVVGETIRAFRRRPEARTRRELADCALWLGLAGVGSLANPHGPLVWIYTFRLLGNRAVGSFVTEWAPPSLGTGSGTIFFVLLALAVAVLIRRRDRVDLSQLLALGAFGALALSAGRNVMWFAALAAVLLAPLYPAGRAVRRRESTVLNTILLAMLIVPVVLLLPPLRPALDLPPRLGAVLSPQTPVLAVARLASLPHRPERLFHDSGFGSYLMWAAPEQRVFADSRIEFYPIEQWYDYIRLGQGLDFDMLTARYGFDGFLLNPESQAPLIELLRGRADWTETITTDAAILFQPAP